MAKGSVGDTNKERLYNILVKISSDEQEALLSKMEADMISPDNIESFLKSQETERGLVDTHIASSSSKRKGVWSMAEGAFANMSAPSQEAALASSNPPSPGRAQEDEQEQVGAAAFEKRVADKAASLQADYGQKLADIFAWLPDDKRADLEANIETGADRDIQDLIIDFALNAEVSFKSNDEVASAQAQQEDALGAAAGAAVPDSGHAIRAYVERSLQNYARAYEAQRVPELEIPAPQFKDKDEALVALKAAQTELAEAKKQFTKVLANEQTINTVLKSKASGESAEKLTGLYQDGLVPSMLQANNELKKKAQKVIAIANSEHIQSTITPEALQAEKPNLSYLVGRKDSPAAINKRVALAQKDANDTSKECQSSGIRFEKLEEDVREVAEIKKYQEILPLLITQLPSSQQKVVLKQSDSVKSTVFNAVQYLASHGSIKPDLNLYKEKEARIKGSADRISEGLARFTPEARERILQRTAAEMVITSNPFTLLEVTFNRDRKRGFNHFMEQFNIACKAEEKTSPKDVLKPPEKLGAEDKDAVFTMCTNLDEEFNATVTNAAKPRPSVVEIVGFTLKRVGSNIVKNPVVQHLALGAVGAAFNASAPTIANMLGPKAAGLALEAAQQAIEGGKNALDLHRQGHSPKIAGLLAAAEVGVDAVTPHLRLNQAQQKIFKDDFLVAMNQFAEELKKPSVLNLIEAAAQNKAIEPAPEDVGGGALVARGSASAVAAPNANGADKAPGEAAKEVLVKRMMDIALNPMMEKFPSIAANQDLRKTIDGFCKPYFESMVNTMVAEAKVRLGKALTPSEQAAVVAAAEVKSEMPKGVQNSAQHISDAAAAFINNQASPKPAPLGEVAALAGIVAAGNIAGEVGVDPAKINLVANFVAQAAGIGSGGGAGDSPQAAAKLPTPLQIEEIAAINPELVEQAKDIGRAAAAGIPLPRAGGAAKKATPPPLPPKEEQGRG